MRVLLLTQWFEPEPLIKGLALATALRDAGHEVRVLTGFPNYPGGKLYPGYRVRLIQREVMDGIPITRMPLYPEHSRSKIGRIANYLSFGASALLYGVFSRWRPDVIYVYHPPLTTGIAGALIGLLRRIPFVLDVQDLWPDTLKATGMLDNPRILSAVGRCMRWVYRRAAVILPQSEGFRRRMIEDGIAAEKIHVILNYCQEKTLSERPKGSWNPPGAFHDKFLIGYAGNMGMAQATDTLLEAAALIQSRSDSVHFFFVGGGTEVDRLKEKAVQLNLKNTTFIPPMLMHEVGAILEIADVLLVHLRKDPLFSITIPGKIQAYMFMGKPILVAVPGDAAELVQKAACGIIAESENAPSIAAAICELADMPEAERAAMGARGHDYYMRELSIAAAARKITAALEQTQKTQPR